jgi:2-succinyl-6-hydroxy-2,4-cyclohexadiene-1-carboxylate synthase
MKESIIFLHGIVGNKGAFKAEIDQLKDQYHCISYDFYDANQLGEDHPLSIDTLLDQLYEQFTKNNIQKAHLCALSYGCVVAMAFAQKYLEMVSSLTFIGGYCVDEPSSLRTNMETLLNDRDQYDYKSWVKQYAQKNNPNKKQIPEDSEAIFVKSALYLHPKVFEKACRLQFEFDYKKALKNIKAPVLWVMGEYDHVHKGTLGNLRQHLQDVDYREIKEAGHVAHIHQPAAFLSLYKAFLVKLNNSIKKPVI